MMHCFAFLYAHHVPHTEHVEMKRSQDDADEFEDVSTLRHLN